MQISCAIGPRRRGRSLPLKKTFFREALEARCSSSFKKEAFYQPKSSAWEFLTSSSNTAHRPCSEKNMESMRTESLTEHRRCLKMDGQTRFIKVGQNPLRREPF